MAKQCKVIKPCFYKGKRLRIGDTAGFDGDKLPSYLEEIQQSEPVKRQAKAAAKK